LVSAIVALREPRTTMGGVNLFAGFRPELWPQVVPDDAPEDVASFNQGQEHDRDGTRKDLYEILRSPHHFRLRRDDLVVRDLRQGEFTAAPVLTADEGTSYCDSMLGHFYGLQELDSTGSGWEAWPLISDRPENVSKWWVLAFPSYSEWFGTHCANPCNVGGGG
jgi:hypothetical protein